jgi:hypothetical protein
MSNPWANAASKLLKHPWWAGLSGIIALAALVVAILQLTGSDPQRAPSVTAGGNTASGDCIAQGAGNEVTCSYKVYPPAPASIGAVEVSSLVGFATYLFEGQPAQLPEPPNYPVHEAGATATNGPTGCPKLPASTA